MRMRIANVAVAVLVCGLTGGLAVARWQGAAKPPKLPVRVAPVSGTFGVPKAARNLPKANRVLRPVSTRSATTFRPSGTRLTLDALLARTEGTPEEKAAMGRQLEEVFTAYEAQAKKLDMESDVAGALSFFLTTHYQVYRGGAKISDPARVAVFRQFQSALDTDQIRGLTDEEKQQAYETLILQSAATLIGYRAAVESKDKETIREARTYAGRTLTEMVKAEPDRVSLGDEGFSIAGRRS
jgi:hypothetical protein